MDYTLNIGKLTETIESYNSIIDKLEKNSEERKSILDKLFTDGWSGSSKEEFEEKHKENEQIYKRVPKYINYLNNALETLEKPKAVELKRCCENFISIISRIGTEGDATSDDEGNISLLNSGVIEINSIANACIDSYLNTMQNKLNEINDILDSFSYTSFGIDSNVYECQSSINTQKNNLNDFKYSLGTYSQNFVEMESTLISKLDSIINGKQGKHRSYIFYQPGIVSGDKLHTFDDQARIEKEKYEMKYPGTEVVLVAVNNPQEFKDAWNDMDDIGADIDAVQVILHGSVADDDDGDEYAGAGYMYFENPNNRSDHSNRITADTTAIINNDTDVLISDLNKKEINNLYFSSCNTSNPDVQNVSDAFDKIADVNTITGFDGTALYYYNDINPIESYEAGSQGGQENTFFAYVGRDENGKPLREKEGKVTNTDRY